MVIQSLSLRERRPVRPRERAPLFARVREIGRGEVFRQVRVVRPEGWYTEISWVCNLSALLHDDRVGAGTDL